MLEEATDPQLELRLVAIGAFIVFGALAFNALRRRRIAGNDPDREYRQAKHPAIFWFHVIAHAIVAGLFLCAATIKPRLFFLGTGMMFLYFAINHIRIGKLKPSVHDSVYTRSKTPSTFWFHVAVELILACACFTALLAWK